MHLTFNPLRFFGRHISTAVLVLILADTAMAGPVIGLPPTPAATIQQSSLPAVLTKPAAPVLGPLPGPLSPTVPSPPNTSSSGEVAALVSSDNQFAFDLYRALSGKNTSNMVFSPYSISTALAMTYAGARGQTANEIAKTLHFTLPEDQLAPAMGKLIGDVSALPGAAYQLDVANRLWGQTGKSFLPAFLSTMSTAYQAPLSQLDFIDDPESSRNAINTWTADQTNQKIQNLMPQGSITSNMRLVLTNAIYFNGKWASPFNTSLTRPENFTLASGSLESAPMMHQEGSFKYGTFQNFSMLEMPYQGSSLSMVVILPNSVNGLTAVEKSLTPQTLDQDESKLSRTQVKVGLPKFTINSGFGLGGTLAKMGMPTAFTPFADFSGMDGQHDLHVNSIEHKAFINVDEAGTEAAAATGVGIGILAILVDPTPPAIFDADHAFDFLIVDNKTGSLLFMGRETDPGGTLLTSPLAADPYFASSSGIQFSTVDRPLSAIGSPLLGPSASPIAPPSEPLAISAVPEPSTFGLVVVGVLGLIVLAKRHRWQVP